MQSEVGVYLALTDRIGAVHKQMGKETVQLDHLSYARVEREVITTAREALPQGLLFTDGGSGIRNLGIIVDEAVAVAEAENSPVVYIRPRADTGKLQIASFNRDLHGGVSVRSVGFYVQGDIEYGIQPHTTSEVTAGVPPRHGRARTANARQIEHDEHFSLSR
jgi:hypothetical protein